MSRPDELTRAAFEQKIVELGASGRYIAAKDGKIIGHALLDPMGLHALAHVFRLTVVVHPGYPGSGIGTALMRALLDWAERTPRVGKIELLVRSTNERAIRLYSKLGFVEEGRFKNRIRLPDNTFVDDLAMAWFPKRQ